ncbi:MAG: sigma 54-interacting transcriptional regulator [Pseudomonadota bacterium]
MEEPRAELKLRALHQALELVGQSLELDRALEGLLQVAQRTLAARRGGISLLDEAGDLVYQARLLPEHTDARPVAELDLALTRQALRSRQPFCLAGSSRQPLFLGQPGSSCLERQSIAWMVAPLLWRGEPQGMICLDRLFGDGADPEEDLEFLGQLASLASQMVGLEGQMRARQVELRRRNRCLHGEVAEGYNHFLWLGQSPAVLEAYRLMEKVAPSRAPVLLLGETGSGKTLAARIIHELSPRAGYPFQKLHCAGWSEEQLEAELFGHEPVGYRGQERAGQGRLEQINGGTLFLDGIASLSLTLQAKLLRFLQEGEVERPGDGQARRVDVRVVAASQRDLAGAVDQGRFREDLFYRLGVFPIPLPPLRERGDDVRILLEYFLDQLAKRRGRRLELSPAARRGLLAYAWPGNLLEMINLLERLDLLVRGSVVDLAELAPYLASAPCGSAPAEEEPSLSRLEELERREVMAALERHNWVQSHAARELGLTLRQIGYRIKKFGLAPTIDEQRRRGSLPARRNRGASPSPSGRPQQPHAL